MQQFRAPSFSGKRKREEDEGEVLYSCTWRKPQGRKHKTWDGDGVLSVRGDRGVLRDADSRKELASGRWTEGQTTIGSLEIEIEGPIAPSSPRPKSAPFGAHDPRPAPSRPAVPRPSQPRPAVPPVQARLIQSRPPAPTSLENGRQDDAKTFACMHRVPQPGKKNQTWTSDGVVVVQGGQAALKDSVGGRTLATAGADPSWSDGDIVRIGSRQVQIGAELDPATEAKSGPAPRRQPEERHVGRAEPPKVPKPSVGLKAPPTPRLQGEKMARPDEAWLRNHNPKDLPVVDVVLDSMLGERLRPHQIECCTMGMRAAEAQGCLLADDMGLGKTVQAIGLMWTLLRQNPLQGAGPVIERAMIVCPVTLIKNWAREIAKWLGRDRLSVFVADNKSDLRLFGLNKRFSVLIIGYERLRAAADELKSVYPPIGLVIADEGHRLKSAGAKTAQALRLVKTPRRVILSGTPIQNNLQELYHMCDYVCPGLLDDYPTFKKTFESPILRSREPGCSKVYQALGLARSEQLGRLANAFVLRRASDVIADFLPPRIDRCLFVAPTALQLRLYAAVLESPEVRDVLAGQDANRLVLIDRLRKLCNSPSLLDATADHGSSGKMLVVQRLLAELARQGQEKIVLVSNFTTVLDIFESLCRSGRHSFCRLDGSTPQHERDGIVQRFNTSPDCSVFLLSSKSGGVGLNLIGASRLVLFDPDWNPAVDHQSMARIWRQGQTRPCFIYRLFTTGTIEECIFQRQIFKRGLAGDLIQDSVKAAKTDAFTAEDLRSLFVLRTDTACATHDLLGCTCLSGEDISDDVSEEASSDDVLGFLPASQVRPPTTSRQKLADLQAWTHIDCRDPDAVQELDDVLLSLVGARDITGGDITFVLSKTFSTLAS